AQESWRTGSVACELWERLSEQFVRLLKPLQRRLQPDESIASFESWSRSKLPLHVACFKLKERQVYHGVRTARFHGRAHRSHSGCSRLVLNSSAACLSLKKVRSCRRRRSTVRSSVSHMKSSRRAVVRSTWH